MSTPTETTNIREVVREHYAKSALRVIQPEAGCGCGPDCCTPIASNDPITSNLYSAAESADLPEAAVLASLGCGNPTALAELQPGEVVLDLGSGGGIDVLLSAKRVGPDGFAFGLDMTDEMLALAEKNKAAAGAKNVAFIKGTIEEIPLPANSVDVIISNCVINLSADKGQVLREAYRVLKPGGRFAVSDVVTQGDIPADIRKSLEAWVGCIAGALGDDEYKHLLTEAGFKDADIEVTRVYDPASLAAADASCCDASCCGPTGNVDSAAFARLAETGGRIVSGFIRAIK